MEYQLGRLVYVLSDSDAIEFNPVIAGANKQIRDMRRRFSANVVQSKVLERKGEVKER